MTKKFLLKLFLFTFVFNPPAALSQASVILAIETYPPLFIPLRSLAAFAAALPAFV